MGNILLSLCLPTNGIVEWVLPVLDSIYNQNIQESLFEVVVTDNGNNNEFEIKMNKYLIEHTNLVYKKTNAQMFHNQLEALKLASGQYLKFVNHRATMEKQSIEKMLEIIKENIHEKPVLFFANGTMRNDYSCTSFDEFVEKLGHYASWTTGVGIWKTDYESLPRNMSVDSISPHSCILFANRNKHSYKLINFVFSKEIDTDHMNSRNPE